VCLPPDFAEKWPGAGAPPQIVDGENTLSVPAPLAAARAARLMPQTIGEAVS